MLIQLSRCTVSVLPEYISNIFCKQNIYCTYVALTLLPAGMLAFLYGKNPRRLIKRRTVDKGELESLYSEVERYHRVEPPDEFKIAEQEVKKLQKMQEDKTELMELDVLGLRSALVDLYSEKELIAKAEYELELLDEFIITKKEKEKYGEWKERLKNAKKGNGVSEDRVNQEEEGKDKDSDALRAVLRALREKVAWYEQTWAEGSVILTGVSYWASLTMFAVLLIGLLPLVHSQGNDELIILHWIAFGFVGGLLSVLVNIKNQDVAEVGDTDGKQVMQQALLSIGIGSMTAVLLYAALSGGLVEGKMFPRFSDEVEQSLNVHNGLSIFWGIFAGFSLEIFASLRGVAESAFGKGRSD